MSEKNRLYRDFFCPPFSVLDARGGWWNTRKRLWLDEGLRSDIGRKKTWASMTSAWAVSQSRQKSSRHVPDKPPPWTATSIFDPVLAEVIYHWFAPPGGKVLDPFAGGIVRGLVASRLGLEYTGFEIRPVQIAANRRQLKRLQRPGDPPPQWIVQDACAQSIQRAVRKPVDLIFTCPPYGNLEVYSKNPADISTMPWDTFAGALSHSVKTAAARLKDNRFAVYVVSDLRGPNGGYQGLPDVVRRAARRAGLIEYAEIVLLQLLGTAPVRARGGFEKTRKPCRVHQLVLVFLKGDGAAAAADMGTITCKDPFLKPTTA